MIRFLIKFLVFWIFLVFYPLFLIWGWTIGFLKTFSVNFDKTFRGNNGR